MRAYHLTKPLYGKTVIFTDDNNNLTTISRDKPDHLRQLYVIGDTFRLREPELISQGSFVFTYTRDPKARSQCPVVKRAVQMTKAEIEKVQQMPSKKLEELMQS